jgi:DNA-binding CsgD family transcriptional regulator
MRAAGKGQLAEHRAVEPLPAIPPRGKSPAFADASVLQSTESWHAAIAMRLQRQEAQVEAHVIVDVLGLGGLAAAVLGHAGQVLAANGGFVELVPVVVREMTGRLRFADASADCLIDQALAANCKGHAQGILVPWIAIRGRGDRPPAIVQLMPLRSKSGEPFARAILTITLVRPRPAPRPQVLQRLFGLSPAEARIASGLAAQQTIAAMADGYCVSRETVRSQVKTVLGKTGTKRQLDLAVLLAGLPVPNL